MQLRTKINRLGDLLLGMGAARRKVPWPTWFDVPSLNSGNGGGGGFSDNEGSGVTSPLSASQNFPAGIAAAAAPAASVHEMEQVRELPDMMSASEGDKRT